MADRCRVLPADEAAANFLSQSNTQRTLPPDSPNDGMVLFPTVRDDGRLGACAVELAVAEGFPVRVRFGGRLRSIVGAT